MNKTRTIGRGNAVRNVIGIAAAAAIAGSVAIVNPVAAQNQPPSDLRTSLTASLAEHTLLAGNATAAILGNRPAEFQAASATLNQNSSRIAGLIGNLYGGNANSAFLPLWQRHIQYYADYANALKAGNESGKQQASSNLVQWSADMGMMLNSPAQFRTGQNAAGTMNQQGQAGDMSGTQNMLTQMMQQHVMDTMKVIDAQAANNWPLVYSLAAADVRHMKNVAADLIDVHSNTNASAYQGANADLKANLAMLLVENAALNANATSALLNDRTPEYQAASAALKDNTAALSSQLGAVYGGNAYSNLNSVWNNQSLKLSQYANALAKQDVDTQAAARSNVRGFTEEFANGFNQSNAQVPALTLNGWGGTLTTGVINLIDAQDARNFAQEYQLRAQTNQQLLQLTNVLGQSIGQQFPNQYGIPSAPAVPANVGSTNDNTSVASNSNTGTGTTAGTTSAGSTAGTGGATTATGSADATGSTAGTTATSGDASAADSGTVLLPTTGSDLSSSVQQVTGTTTTTDTTGTTGTSITSTTGTTGTTTASTSVTGTTGTTGTTTSDATSTGSVLLPQTGADLSSSVQQVTGTTTTTDTTGTSITSTTGTTGTTTAGASVTGTTGTTTSGATSTGSVLLPQTGADLSSSVQQVTGTTTTTDTTGTGTTGTGTSVTGTTTTTTTTGDEASTTGSGVLLPQSGADLSQQQQATPNSFVPIAMVIAGIALIMSVVLMTFARRDYRQQNRDQ